jgi:hypothetical protein
VAAAPAIRACLSDCCGSGSSGVGTLDQQHVCLLCLVALASLARWWLLSGVSGQSAASGVGWLSGESSGSGLSGGIVFLLSLASLPPLVWLVVW